MYETESHIHRLSRSHALSFYNDHFTLGLLNNDKWSRDYYNVLTMIMAKRFLPIVLSNTRIHSEISVQRILKIEAVKV